MNAYKRSKITLFQLFFLSFSYVFSGLFLIRERSFLSFFIPLGAILLFSALGFLFLEYAPRRFTEKERFVSFLSCGQTHFFAKLFAVILMISAVVEALLSVIAFSFSARKFSVFIPFWLIFALLLIVGFFLSSHGLTALGRFSELTVFLIIPLLFWLVFWDIHPMDIRAFSGNGYSFFLVMPAAVFYLLSMTVSESTAMPKGFNDIRVFPLVTFFGACLAVFCMILFRLYGASDDNIFFLFFGWMTSLVRIGILLSVRV
ncbi:MAG: hypothetical protein IJ489_07520 [Clostridia bacterium]|nr:hypothetical protein [Clostridia bacterium]